MERQIASGGFGAPASRLRDLAAQHRYEHVPGDEGSGSALGRWPDLRGRRTSCLMSQASGRLGADEPQGGPGHGPHERHDAADLRRGAKGHQMGEHLQDELAPQAARSRTRGLLAGLLAVAAASVVLLLPAPAQAQLCPDVPHDPDPVELSCGSKNERWAVVDPGSGSVTNVVGWNGTNLWRPPVGQIAIDLPDGSPVGPGWWLVDGEFIRDSFERNLTARADILSVHLSWSTGGLGMETFDVRYTVTVQPTGAQHTATGSSLTLDPLDAGVSYSFTVTATLPDGRTVQGPTVSATPQEDPDPECTDRSVARECRAATNWAHVVEATGYVSNVSVCHWNVCGDPDSDYRKSFNARGILLIDLAGFDLPQQPGIGWRYVDGTFVDVRPRDEELESVTSGAQEPGLTNGDASEGAAPETDGDTNEDTNEDTDESAAARSTDQTSVPGTTGGTAETGNGSGDDGREDAFGTSEAPSRSPDARPLTPGGEVSAGTTGEDADGQTDVSAEEKAGDAESSNFVRRIASAIASFFSGLFSR